MTSSTQTLYPNTYAALGLAPLIRCLAGKTGRSPAYVGKLAGWRSTSKKWHEIYWGQAKVPVRRAENLATALFLAGKDHAHFVLWVHLAHSSDLVALEFLDFQISAKVILPLELEKWRYTARIKVSDQRKRVA